MARKKNQGGVISEFLWLVAFLVVIVLFLSYFSDSLSMEINTGKQFVSQHGLKGVWERVWEGEK